MSANKQDWSRYAYWDLIKHQQDSHEMKIEQQQDSHEMKIVGLTYRIKKILDSSKILARLEPCMEFPPDFYRGEGQQKKIEAFATAEKSFIETMAHQFYVNAALSGYDVEVYLRPKK